MQKEIMDIINNYYLSLGRSLENCNEYVEEREIVAQRELLRNIGREISIVLEKDLLSVAVG